MNRSVRALLILLILCALYGALFACAKRIGSGENAESALSDEVTEDNSAVVAHIFETIPKIAAAEGLKNGYRVISTCGDDAAQSVKHLHFHILGGKKMTEKMA